MHKRIFPLIIFLVFNHLLIAQNRTLDSLYAALKNHPQQDTIRVFLLNELSVRVLKTESEESLRLAEEAKMLAEQLKFQFGIGEAKNNLAIYQLMRGNSDTALELALDGVRIGERMRDTLLLANSYAIIGTIYHRQLAYDKARHYLHKAEELNHTLNNVLIGSKIYNALGGIARDKKNYDSAFFYYKKAMSIMKEGKEDYRLPEVINNIALLYTRQNMNGPALEYYYMALKAAEKSDNRRAQALALHNIGNTLLFQKKYEEAQKLLMQSLTLSKQVGDLKIVSANYMALGHLKNVTGKFDEAHIYLSNFYELKDSLESVTKAKHIAELEIRYETEKKEHQIQMLEKDKKIQMLWTNILIACTIFLGILAVLMYILQKNKERKNRLILNLEIEQLTTQNKELSEKYKDVLTSGDVRTIESADQRILKKAIEVIENNISDPLFGVELMSKELGMSRTNMHRKIKAITGFPPSELIRSIRLRKAASLLLQQADSVSQIGFTVGFIDHSYFSKSFKKHFGVTPSEYIQSREKMN